MVLGSSPLCVALPLGPPPAPASLLCSARVSAWHTLPVSCKSCLKGHLDHDVMKKLLLN